MSYIIVYSTNEDISQGLYRLSKTNPELFAFKICDSKGTGLSIQVMKNNGRTLAHLSSLAHKHPNEIFMWESNRIMPKEFPEECIKGGKWMAEKPGRKLGDIPKFLGLSREELDKIKLEINKPKGLNTK